MNRQCPAGAEALDFGGAWLCVSDKLETSGDDLLRAMAARAGDTPDFSTLQARLKETRTEVRWVFEAIVGGG